MYITYRPPRFRRLGIEGNGRGSSIWRAGDSGSRAGSRARLEGAFVKMGFKLAKFQPFFRRKRRRERGIVGRVFIAAALIIKSLQFDACIPNGSNSANNYICRSRKHKIQTVSGECS